jgi:hypothetical protein
MFSVGHELVEQSKLAAAKETAGEPFSGRRDLLSLLVKANLSADIPERQRLSDEEVIARTRFPLPSCVVFTNVFFRDSHFPYCGYATRSYAYYVCSLVFQGMSRRGSYFRNAIKITISHQISSAIAWALHSLSLNQEAQTKLREEVLSISSDSPTMDELNSLVWLEYVVRENMRLYAPVVFATRMAMQDDVLPLGKPYIDQNGRMHDSLP